MGSLQAKNAQLAAESANWVALMGLVDREIVGVVRLDAFVGSLTNSKDSLKYNLKKCDSILKT